MKGLGKECEKHKFEMEGGGEDDEEEDEGQAEVQGDIEMEQDESMEALVNNNNNIVTPQNPVQADGDEEMIQSSLLLRFQPWYLRFRIQKENLEL